jgi:hypothetical protein
MSDIVAVNTIKDEQINPDDISETIDFDEDEEEQPVKEDKN